MSRQIKIGNLTLGGGAPVRVQSMTNTDTMDTRATVEQTLRMVEAGCELVRITAPDVKAAENLGRIKEELLKRGCEVPLVADIHFNPKAAEVAATLVEKVRVNPGNYTDRNTGKLEFTDQEYNDELKRIGERMASLIDICKRHHTAMRIGTNHGSLSERIMSRYVRQHARGYGAVGHRVRRSLPPAGLPRPRLLHEGLEREGDGGQYQAFRQ